MKLILSGAELAEAIEYWLNETHLTDLVKVTKVALYDPVTESFGIDYERCEKK